MTVTDEGGMPYRGHSYAGNKIFLGDDKQGVKFVPSVAYLFRGDDGQYLVLSDPHHQ